MLHSSKSQLEKKLKATEAQIRVTEQELDHVGAEMQKLKEQERTMKLIRIGKICEDAGVLNDYNANDLYMWLVLGREYVCHRQPLNKIFFPMQDAGA